MSISQTDKQAIADLWIKALESDSGRLPSVPKPTSLDLKKLFCEDWPEVEKFLQAIRDLLPQPGPIIVDWVIKFGDAAHKHFCSGSKV